MPHTLERSSTRPGLPSGSAGVSSRTARSDRSSEHVLPDWGLAIQGEIIFSLVRNHYSARIYAILPLEEAQTVRHPSKAGIEIQGRFILVFQDLEGFFRCCSILLSRILQESPGERVYQRRAPAGAYVDRNPLFCVWQRTGYLSAYQFANSTADA